MSYDVNKPQQTEGFMIYHKRPITLEERLLVMAEHTKLFEKILGDTKSFAIMKKHYKAYANDFEGAKELRTRLMEAKDAHEVEYIVGRFLPGAIV